MPNEEMGGRSLPQPPDVATRVVIIVVAGFLGFVALSMAGIFVYLRSTVPSAFRAAVESRFPEPVLQKNPRRDFLQFERQQRTALSSYGWIDRARGISRIPIDEAMRMIAARGAHAYDPLDQPLAPSSGGNPNGDRP